VAEGVRRMSVWFAIPSCRPAAEAEKVLGIWRRRGYRIALLRQGDPVEADLSIPTDTYLGWAASVNFLCRVILATDTSAKWIVTGGDDYEPDRSIPPNWIAEECNIHFGGTFGVMQPTGDRWGEDPGQPNCSGSALIDRICGSPWLGRDFCERMYGGRGPMFEDYRHMFADEELQNVAMRLGVLWQRRELVQLHQHWARKTEASVARDCPDYMKPFNGSAHWHESKTLFERRRAEGFPGSEPLNGR
jgi:hypothetical protein